MLEQIGALVTSLNTIREFANIIKAAKSAMADAEIQMQLADLMNALSEAKLKVSDINDVLALKDERIRELEAALKTKESLFYDGSVYWIGPEEERDGPYCPICWDDDRKLIHLSETDWNWYCELHKETFSYRLRRLRRQS